MSGFIQANSNVVQVSSNFDDGLVNETNCCGPFKVLLLGDAFVGKSSILRRFVNDKFDQEANYCATVGIDYKRKIVRIDEDKFVKLQIWDTAGQERFRGLAKNYYRGADAVALVYDVTDPRSFVDLPGWLEELASYSVAERHVLQILIANKIDLENQRQVSSSCGQALADKFKLDYMETSAKSGTNVNAVFRLLAESLAIAHKLEAIIPTTSKTAEAKSVRKETRRESFRVKNSTSSPKEEVTSTGQDKKCCTS